MKYFRLSILLFLTTVLYSSAFSQQDSIPVTTIVEKNTKQITDIPYEKVYLHFDKPYYAVGDTMWFKAYLTSVQNIPSPLSKIVYVDVLTGKDSLVSSIKIPIVNSVASGSIPISNLSYKQGNYYIKAYTKWMLNFDADYFFTKNITIGNSINRDLSTHITFAKTASGKNLKVNVKVEFKDEDNRPLANKKVNWEVVVDYDRIGRGKGETDAKGLLNVEFSSSKDLDFKYGKLNTTIDIENNKTLNASFPLASVNLDNDIQFFPEGGELIAGLPMQVGFKAQRSNGLGVDAKGEIVDSEGNILTTISSQHLGMGKFSFTPESGKVYFANVVFADGTKETFTLPAVKPDGINLSVDNSDPVNLKFTIRVNPSYLAKQNNSGFYIVGRSGGVVYYAAQSVLRNKEYSSSIPKKNFPSGIVQLSILSSSGKVLSERIAFNRQMDSLKMDLVSDLPKYKQRQKVSMKLNVSNPDTIALGNFSVAVIDENKVPVNEDKETTILSSLLLSSDIGGYIENPNYYFHSVSDKKRENLDLLMLTQGYRRYLYQDIIADKTRKISFLPEQGLTVSGIIRRKDGMPLSNGRLLLQIPERSFYKDGTTDEKGRFSFTNLVLHDSVEVVINARNNLNSDNLMINIDGEAFPASEKNPNAADDILNIDSALQTYLANSKLQNSTGFILKEVAIEGRVKKPSHSDHSALTGLSMQADYLTKGEQLSGCNDLLTCMSTTLGLMYVENYLYLSRAYNAGSRTPVEIYVNGMPVDISYLHSIQPAGVESIEVFNNDGLTGINQRSNTQGVVVINMKEVKKVKMSKQDIKDLFPPTNIMTFSPKGYTVERQFYVPKYTGPRTSLQTKDNRSTIYWNPFLLTDEKGSAEFEYFTADDKGTYRVVIEGIDDDGYFGRKVYRFQVE